MTISINSRLLDGHLPSISQIMSFFYGFVLSLLIAYFVHMWHEWRRLSHVPGPAWAAFTRLWMVRQTLKQRQPYAFKKVNEIYGSLVRVGPNEVVTNDPEVMRRMMGVRSNYTRGNFYKAAKFDPARDNLLSMRDELAHSQLRAKMAAGYSGKENESMESTIAIHIANFIHLIETKYLSTTQIYRPVDFGEKASFFTLDVISDLAFGQAFGYLDTDEDKYDYLEITKASIPFMMTVADIPALADVLQSRVLRKLFPSETDKLGFGAFIGVAKDIVAERFQPDAETRFDMLGSFIRHGLTQDEAAGEALLQIIAGSDTSANTVRAFMLHVLTNPTSYMKLQSEIDEGIRTGGISSPVTDAEARSMPYLQAAIKEALRMMPPATGAMFKQVPPGGDVIDGKYLPEGTQIAGSILAIQHSKRIYGPDADIFRPERWIEASTEKAAEMSHTVDLCFHYGKYQCLGRAVAYMEFNKLFVELFRRFDFSICQADRPTKLSVAGLWIMEDFWIRTQHRESAK
ncbi:cytochrome P450 [Boeremia exigua]|uniref:cytochrome P450 n=1 Tax=Boeremia exigua TaxID=749465 RepID=UPI001E8DD75C|nr:cytochrome P450 [Boeremia exigua]KAH6629304.1 cytochrome P450 [Boeremia exigua]